MKVLVLRRQVLGNTQSDTIQSVADLAAIYHDQGLYDEAEQITLRVLELRQ
jgi:hypothetical protein